MLRNRLQTIIHVDKQDRLTVYNAYLRYFPRWSCLDMEIIVGLSCDLGANFKHYVLINSDAISNAIPIHSERERIFANLILMSNG